MTDCDMDAAAPPLDLAHASADIITVVLQNLSHSDRFTCALVCKAWAEAATAATRSIILTDRIQDLSCLQRWLEKHGGQVEVLQLHDCNGATLNALPCPELQDLVLHGWYNFDIDSRVWGDIAASTKLTSVSLSDVFTPSQQADVVSALIALPNLQQLTWCSVRCSARCNSIERRLSDSMWSQQLTQLTALQLEDVTAVALEHLGSLTKLQHLSITIAREWAAAGCPGLQEIKALTSLKLDTWNSIPASVCQLTALQQLSVFSATLTALNRLQALPSLTQLCVRQLSSFSHASPPLQLPGLQHLELSGRSGEVPMSFLSSCTQLRVLCVHYLYLVGPGSLVASTLLQHLELRGCIVDAGIGAAGSVSWQQVISAPGHLPHLKLLQLRSAWPTLQQADIECVVSCCSSLQVLHLDTLHNSFASALMRLPDLTSLELWKGNDQQCSLLAQLTGLKELKVGLAAEVSSVGLRQLAALEQLTSLGFVARCYPSKVNPVLEEQMSDRLPGCSHAIISKVRVSLWGEGSPSSSPWFAEGVCHSLPGAVQTTCYSIITYG